MSIILILSLVPSLLVQKDLCTVCGHEPDAMAQGHIISHEPFEIFFQSSSSDIEEKTGEKNILWIETEHFRIGSALESWRVPIKEKKSYLQELTQFSKLFPDINPQTKKLDPWMRLHLMAWRVENLYEEMMTMFGWDEDPFAKLPKESTFIDAAQGDWTEILKKEWLEHQGRQDGLPQWLGLGRYFGMPMKYEILILEDEKPFSILKKEYIGVLDPLPQRWHNSWRPQGVNPVSRSLWYGISTKVDKITHDQHVHNALLHNTAINILDGYMLYLLEAPMWLRVGIGHYYSKRNDLRFNFYDLDEGAIEFSEDAEKWYPLVRKMVSRGDSKGFAKLGQSRNFGDLNFDDHLEAWSKVCFLYSSQPSAFGKWVRLLKTNQNRTNNLTAQREALKEAFNWTFSQADTAWETWVMENKSEQ